MSGGSGVSPRAEEVPNLQCGGEEPEAMSGLSNKFKSGSKIEGRNQKITNPGVMKDPSQRYEMILQSATTACRTKKGPFKKTRLFFHVHRGVLCPNSQEGRALFMTRSRRMEYMGGWKWKI